MALRMRLVVALLAVSGGPVLVAAAVVSRAVFATMAATGAALAVLAAWWLTRAQRRKLAELARAGERAGAGELAVRVPVQPGDETEPLAAALNRMTHRTQAYRQALTASRTQLRAQLAVLGDTLSSTHDLDRMLDVVLRAARTATGARSAAVLLLDHETAVLVGHIGDSDQPGPAGRQRHTPVAVPLGAGLLGSVAATGEARRGRVAVDGPGLHRSEPRCDTYLAVPISAVGGPTTCAAAPWPVPPATATDYAAGLPPSPLSGSHTAASPFHPPPYHHAAVRGVLALYDRLGGDEFDDGDLADLRTFAGQVAVAVNNVHAYEEAQRLSLTDPLTGLWNYRYLTEAMRREVERASRYGHPLAVLALDLDRFKEVNDAYGHAAGDDVLVEFARRISRATREMDQAFRQGGEEFVVLLPETEARGATRLAQRLRTAVREQPIRLAARGGTDRLAIPVTVSVGIAVYPEHGLTPRAVLDAADHALYAAKAAGRDTCRVAKQSPPPATTSELQVRFPATSPAGDLPRAGGTFLPTASRPAGQSRAATSS